MPRATVPAAVIAAFLALPAVAQDTIPLAVPFGSDGAAVAAAFEAREMRVLSRGGGRDVHAATPDRQVQAVAVLAADTLVGVVFYHPETPRLNAHDVFARASAGAELRHGPPACRRSGLAVWEVEGGVLEVRLRGPAGDGAPGAEVRYLAPGYDAELARGLSARRVSQAGQRPREGAAGGRRLLGVPADAVAPDPPAGDESGAVEEAGGADAPAAPPLTARCD
jgi:hypothetical protein